jgi:hypothetical protein
MLSVNAVLKTYPVSETYHSSENPATALPHRKGFRPFESVKVEKPAASSIARFLQRVLNPGTLATSALLLNTMGSSISSAMNPFKPVTLRDYMVQAYHELFCITQDPSTPIDPAIWKLEQRVLVAYAKQRMLDYNKTHPDRQTPTLPTGPAPIAPPTPGQTPVPPCCAGGNLVATLRRQGGQKGRGGAKVSQSLNA